MNFKSTKLNLTTTLALIGMLTISVSYVILPQFVPSQYAWGWEHFSARPNGMVLTLAISIFVISALVYAASRNDLGILQKRIIRIALILSIAGLSWYFRLNISLGDQDIFLQMLTHGHYFRMSQPLTTAIYGFVYDVVAFWNWPPQNAIALVCSGTAVFVIEVLRRFLARFSDEIAFSTSMLLVPSTIIVLFFGYIETTVLAVALHLLFFYYAWKTLYASEPLWKPALFLGLAVASHGLSVYLIPSLIFLGFVRRTDDLDHKQYLKQLIVAFLVLIVPTVLLIVIAFTNQELIRGSLVGDSLGGADMRPFVPLISPASSHERYLIFSWEHLVDLINLMVLISPFVLLILVFSFSNRKYFFKTSWRKFLAISMLGGLGFAFIWNPDLGMKNDWDLFSPFLLPVFLIGGDFFAGKFKSIIFVFMALLTAVNSAFFIQTLSPVAAWSPAIAALPKPVVQYQTSFVWDEKFELIGYDIHPKTTVSAGEDINITLYFRGLEHMPVGYTPFLHLVNEHGDVVAQDDHQPFPPTEYWPPGRVYLSEFTLKIPETANSNKSLDVIIGAYFWQTLERLALLDNGLPVQNNVITLTVIEVE